MEKRTTVPVSQKRSLTVVLVPGLMGSTLRYAGTGKRQELVEFDVWGEDLSSLFDALSSHPERLAGPLQVGPVLRHIKAYNRNTVSLYGPILAQLERMVKNHPLVTLATFPYDWRQDIRLSAKALQEWASGRPEGTDFCFVAHSLGAWVVRHSLMGSAELQGRTKLLVQLAPPILGASSAFYSLRHSLEMRFIGGLTDWIRTLRKMTSGGSSLDVRLRESLASFDSMYLLMPPESEMILANSSGQYFNAFDRRLWPSQYHPKLVKAEEVHAQLSAFEFAPTRTCYGSGIVTDRDYIVDEQFMLVGKRPAWHSGDGTVTEASAVHRTPLESRHPIDNAMHHAVPFDAAVVGHLSNLIRQTVSA